MIGGPSQGVRLPERHGCGEMRQRHALRCRPEVQPYRKAGRRGCQGRGAKSPGATAWITPWQPYPRDQQKGSLMDIVDKLWNALGKAIRANASTKQINGIVARLDRARGKR